MLTTTLNAIRAHSPCVDGWTKLLTHLGKTQADDEPLPFATILDSNGLADALWCCRAAPEHSQTWRLYAVWCARQVTDPCAALDVAERHANGEATDAELEAAKYAAWDITRAALRTTAWAAAWSTAWYAAWYAAWDPAWDPAYNSEWNLVWDAQTEKFLEIVGREV